MLSQNAFASLAGNPRLVREETLGTKWRKTRCCWIMGELAITVLVQGIGTRGAWYGCRSSEYRNWRHQSG